MCKAASALASVVPDPQIKETTGHLIACHQDASEEDVRQSHEFFCKTDSLIAQAMMSAIGQQIKHELTMAVMRFEQDRQFVLRIPALGNIARNMVKPRRCSTWRELMETCSKAKAVHTDLVSIITLSSKRFQDARVKTLGDIESHVKGCCVAVFECILFSFWEYQEKALRSIHNVMGQSASVVLPVPTDNFDNSLSKPPDVLGLADIVDIIDATQATALVDRAALSQRFIVQRRMWRRS